MKFENRISAGMALAYRLSKYKNTNAIVLAVPKGGIPVGYMIANELNLPLEPLLSKKIGYPGNPEYAIGAVSTWGAVLTPNLNVGESYLKAETTRIKRYLKQMQKKYMDGQASVQLKDRTVIVVDDGVATGHTLLATVQMLKAQRPARIVIAVPVTTQYGYEMLAPHCDEFVALIIERNYFSGVGAYYRYFDDVSEATAINYLEQNRINRLMHVHEHVPHDS